ncbi:MAG TPA: diguanylate cyclase [Planctomycetota bacterium]|nr:diguanylate cyclase [Planctomycetota bacterium]
MRARAVQIILKRCLGHRDGEAVLVVTDTALEPFARAFQRHAQALGAETDVVSMAPRRGHGEEPGGPVAEALKAAPLAILLTTRSLSAARARRDASDRGARIASLPGVDVARLEGLLDLDYDALRARSEEIARLLEGRRRIRLTTAGGTDLSFDIAGRPVFRDLGDLSQPGAFGHLPAGEVSVAPVEGTAEGVVRVDGSLAGVGRVREPVLLRFERGRLTDAGDPRLRELLQAQGPDAFPLTCFGLGTNPRATVVGNLLEDAKTPGTAHLAFGATPATHVDAVLRDVRVEVDGQPLPEGLLAGPAAPAPTDPGAVAVPSLEAYQILFENANDPQYVLDLDTQKFLEVNPSFERLTGYTREELLSGGLTVAKLVARESLPTYQQKRETRRITPAERYDLKLLTKAGEKRPVELSVRRITLFGRDVVVGAVRDLSHRKKLEQEMWEKIEELGYANSRIYALTEKIRRVPELTPQLLHITDEEELLEKAAQFLCAREGLGYADVNFYLLRDDSLELVHSTIKTRKRKVRLSSDHRLVKVLGGQAPGGMTTNDAVLPLKGRDRNIGVMEVFFHPKEIEVLQDNERALKGYRDLLETLSNVVGLLVDNLHLYEKVRRQSIVDHLTGVYNRRYFDQKLADEISRATRYGRDLSLVLIDIDHFKEINDRISYKQGDQVLVEAARLFRSHTREVDMVCRYGGDEFAILMPETSYEHALAKAEALRQVVRNTPFTHTQDPDKPLRLTLSVGVTGHHPQIRTSDELLRAVDEAVHTAKRSGRDAVCGNFKPPATEPAP